MNRKIHHLYFILTFYMDGNKTSLTVMTPSTRVVNETVSLSGGLLTTRLCLTHGSLLTLTPPPIPSSDSPTNFKRYWSLLVDISKFYTTNNVNKNPNFDLIPFHWREYERKIKIWGTFTPVRPKFITFALTKHSCTDYVLVDTQYNSIWIVVWDYWFRKWQLTYY